MMRLDNQNLNLVKGFLLVIFGFLNFFTQDILRPSGAVQVGLIYFLSLVLSILGIWLAARGIRSKWWGGMVGSIFVILLGTLVAYQALLIVLTSIALMVRSVQ